MVPNFIRSGEWEFVEAPVRFSTAAADEGMRYNGFYLFQALALPCPPGRSAAFASQRKACALPHLQGAGVILFTPTRPDEAHIARPRRTPW